jgi:transcriptional regulator with XRE-family HTH domain
MGRKPNIVRRQEAASLRRQGLTVTEIGRRMGITRQGVHHLLDGAAGDRPIACRECGPVIVRCAVAMGNIRKRPWCVECLAIHPEAIFAERLRPLWLARCMTYEELARAVGISKQRVSRFERRESAHPQWPLLVKLVRVLGPLLVGWHEGQALE